MGLVLLSVAVFGMSAWRDYLDPTLSLLNRLEQEGSGPFMAMIPSAFIALRILTDDAALAGYVQLVIALAAGAFAVWRLRCVDDNRGRWAILIAAMAVMTPSFISSV